MTRTGHSVPVRNATAWLRTAPLSRQVSPCEVGGDRRTTVTLSRWCAVVGLRAPLVSSTRAGHSSPAHLAANSATVVGSVTLGAFPSTTRSSSAVATLSVHRLSRARFLPLRVVSPTAPRQPRCARSVSNQNVPSTLRPPIPVTCASIAIDRGQPTSVPVRAARPWLLRDPLVEACFDAAPVEERRSADVVEIRCFHDRSDATDHRMSTASEK